MKLVTTTLFSPVSHLIYVMRTGQLGLNRVIVKGWSKASEQTNTHNIPKVNTPINPILVLLSTLNLTKSGRGISKITISPIQEITPLVRPMVSRVFVAHLPSGLDLSQKNDGGLHWKTVPKKEPIDQARVAMPTAHDTRRKTRVLKMYALKMRIEALTQNRVGGWNFCVETCQPST